MIKMGVVDPNLFLKQPQAEPGRKKRLYRKISCARLIHMHMNICKSKKCVKIKKDICNLESVVGS